jgi:hypothetical protein
MRTEIDYEAWVSELYSDRAIATRASLESPLLSPCSNRSKATAGAANNLAFYRVEMNRKAIQRLGLGFFPDSGLADGNENNAGLLVLGNRVDATPALTKLLRSAHQATSWAGDPALSLHSASEVRLQ